jgi:hypothetical protein
MSSKQHRIINCRKPGHNFWDGVLDLLDPHANVVVLKILRDHFSLIVSDHFFNFFKLFPFKDESKGFPLVQYPQT